MKQYLDLLKNIKENGTNKPAAREGMPGSKSLFGYQFRHNLQDGFPLLTTKKMFWKGVVVELLWFLKGDTNIKYLVDNGVNIWNEDAYNYYLKKHKEYYIEETQKGVATVHLTFENFIDAVKKVDEPECWFTNYNLGDCGYQYGRVWRDWEKYEGQYFGKRDYFTHIDQIATIILSLRDTPESRRHIVTAIDPSHQHDLALYWCHALFQFNCRPLTASQRLEIWFYSEEIQEVQSVSSSATDEEIHALMNQSNIPKYYLDCQLYQRSADAVLGVPFNIASYALLTHIIAKMCNMIPGEFIHTFGDVHIYDNHWDAVEEQLSREPRELPQLLVGTHSSLGDEVYKDIDTFAENAYPDMFVVKDYNPHPAIKAELSTGLTK